jgi:hypothetical protein
VLYHAEAEWSAREPWVGWMPFHKPVRALMQNQIDCDVLPGDVLIDAATVAEGKLVVADESYRCLIVPYSEALPRRLLSRLADLADQGLPLLFIDRLPTRVTDAPERVIERLPNHQMVRCVPLHKLASLVKGMGFCEIDVQGELPDLHYYHTRYPDLDVYLFVNEHPYRSVETTVELPTSGQALLYDAFANQVYRSEGTERQGVTSLSLNLEPYESIIVLTGPGIDGVSADDQHRMHKHYATERTIEGPWTVATATSEQYPSFEAFEELTELADMSQPGLLPRFSGTLRYETSFEWSGSQDGIAIDLGQVYETAQVWVNGRSAGVCICPPYRLDVGGLVCPGTNELVIEVTNSLVKDQHDFLSRFAQQEPSGLLGPVRLL